MAGDRVHILEHPLLQHKVSLIRDKHTGVKEFREMVSEIAMLMCYEATRELPTKEIEVETPLALVRTKVVAESVALVPVLRAGLGMVEGILRLLPTAKVGHIGVYRDHETLRPVHYYCKMPDDLAMRDVLLLDPMLATGGSAVAAADHIKRIGAKSINFLCIIAAPEGVEAFTKAHPDINVFCAVLDDHLNENGYIVPGLGDAGDRIFGTK